MLGHELMHVYNRDILTERLIVYAIAGVISSVAQMALFGGSSEDRPNPIALIAMALLAPFAAMIIQMAISRTREYDADEDGNLTGRPAGAGLGAACSSGTQQAPLRPTPQLENQAHMMTPTPSGPVDVKKFFSTHLPMDERVARLEQMAYGHRLG